MRILRLAGVPGVGKSTVGWIVATRSAADGTPTGYVDIDQLGMCYPAPEGDPDRWHVKERALARIAREHAAVGVDLLVVSGVADPEHAPPDAGFPTASVWLDAMQLTRRERLAARHWPAEQVEQAVAIGTLEAVRAHDAWDRLSTDGRTAEQIADEVTAIADRIAHSADAGRVPDASAPQGGLIWVTGARCAGASRIGWEIACARWHAGVRTGFMDAGQLGFVWNADAERFGLRCVRALCAEFTLAGTREFVVVAPFEDAPDAVAAELAELGPVVVRVQVDDATRREHAVVRRASADGGPRLAGDDVAGSTDAAFDAILAAGVRQNRTPPRPGEQVVEVTGMAPEDAAAAVRRAAGLTY